ncbi:transcription factor Cys6 [Pyrenophora tritici-repentis]|uniref:Uncharacterized protein n=1 Tax=Pyrenophora tritici-repentis TaxID=45151 RepID=A0A5M9KQU7_9PLEO|nr:transcription factor Cys6 [Pyrenophora tritici-repentis]KAF7569913.1 hypothetical protein PtrM4_123280 [Pyrenophora tritici-repentis]KAG9382371.1 transcription factor Cys6 [Pyrenophora tritici-repentis]KAI1561455.1 C6 transcription factor [Pyrenophora tritici-repentis]
MLDEEQSRVARACDECRRRKRKCDGSSPSCASCAIRGIICFYTTDKQPRKRKRNDEYTLRLEEQIQVLTAKLQALEEQRGADSSARGDASTARSPITNPSGELASNDWGDFEMHSAPAIGEISQLMWRMKLGTDGDVSFIGPSTNFHLSQNVEDNAEGPLIPPISAYIASAPDSNRDTYLYDSNLHLRLFSIFVEDLNKQYDFIDPSRLDEVISPYNPHNTSPLSLLQSAIFATASCFLEDAEAIDHSPQQSIKWVLEGSDWID